jgi:uncharacterized membrane protein
MILQTTLWILFFFLTPVLIIRLAIRYPWIDKIGAVLVNYAIGMVIGNLGLFPENFNKVQDLLTSILILMAIPLLLFTADIKTWLKLAGKTGITLIIGIAALLIAIYSGYFYFSDKIENLWEISGMLVGVYTGGTPNLASIKTALNISPDRFIITHTADTFVCIIYIFFILSVGQKLFGYFLPKFKLTSFHKTEFSPEAAMEDTREFLSLVQRSNRMNVIKSLGLSILVFAIGGGISTLVPEKISMLTVILTITTLGILFSTRPEVQKLKNSFQLGMYLIHVFSLVVASMADFSKFTAIESMEIMFYVAWVVYGTLLLHFVLAYIFKIDTDTFIIVSVAMIFSPPFIPVVASALKNKHVIISGITAGIVGYAIGNYLGVFVALSLK